MSIESALQKAVSDIPECLAGGVSDISTGMLLGVKSVDSHPSEVLETVAAATADLYQGSNVVIIENLFKEIRGIKNSDEHYFQDMLITSSNLIHVFLRSKANQNHVATFVCRGSANMGMVMSKARSSMPAIEAKL